MGTWEEFEAEQAAIEARRAAYPAARDALLAELPDAWPPHPIDPPREGWEDLAETEPTFRERVRGKTWDQIPAELMKRSYEIMSIVPPEGLAELLPGWLAVAATGDDSNVPSWLLMNLALPRAERLRAILSPAQRAMVARTFDVIGMRWAGRNSEPHELATRWRS